MSPRPLPAQLAAAAFLAASLGDPAAFAQTTPIAPPMAVAPTPIRPTPNIAVVNGQIVAAPPPSYAPGSFGFTPNAFNAPLNVTPPPQILPSVLGIDWKTSPANLSSLVTKAIESAKASPGYAKLTTAQKAAAVQASIAAALATSGASAQNLTYAVVGAVTNRLITPEDAVALSAMVAPDLGRMIEGAMFDKIYRGAPTSITSSFNSSPVVSILTSLIATQGQALVVTTTPAVYDPCAGVVAAYCG